MGPGTPHASWGGQEGGIHVTKNTVAKNTVGKKSDLDDIEWMAPFMLHRGYAHIFGRLSMPTNK
jgi:hypothetical protein